MDHDSTWRVITVFNPGLSEQRAFAGYAPAPIPDPRDEALDSYLSAIRSGGKSAVADALARVSEEGRRVLRAYAERLASRAVRDGSSDLLVSALVAVVIGGLDDNALEAMMPMALIEDAGRRISVPVGEFFGEAAELVGHPASVNLMVWLTRKEEDRTPKAMGFAPSTEERGFRYRWIV